MQLVGAYSPLTYNVQPAAPAGTANTEMLGTVYDKTTREPIWSARVSAQAFNGGAPMKRLPTIRVSTPSRSPRVRNT